MRVWIAALFLPFAGAAVLQSHAVDAPAPEIRTLSCDGPFAKDASEESLKAAFGAENVEYKTVPGAEGTEAQATVVFPNDPQRTVTVFWWDETTRAKPASIQVQADYAADPDGANPWKTEILWQSAEGIRIGSTAEDLEKLNGKPFRISGFGWDYGGFAVSWEGGRLEAPEGSCSLSVRFNPSAQTTPEGALGESELMSDSKDMRAAKPRVAEITIGYPADESQMR